MARLLGPFLWAYLDKEGHGTVWIGAARKRTTCGDNTVNEMRFVLVCDYHNPMGLSRQFADVDKHVSFKPMINAVEKNNIEISSKTIKHDPTDVEYQR